MALQCPNCTGKIVYNPETCLLKCTYCDSVLSVDEYSQTKEAKISDTNSDGLKVVTYLCECCGAELCAPRDQIVSYCSYCGNQSTLLQKSEKIERPVKIVPFGICKKDVKEKYKKTVNSYICVPNNFANPEFIEGFRGIYIPYWQTKVNIGSEQIDLKGTTCTNIGKYDYICEYNYKVRVFGDCPTGAYDASEYFDDTIAAEIAPFREDGLLPFNEGYFAGFYADKPSVDAETYKGHIDNEFYSEVKNQISAVSEDIKTPDDSIKSNIKYNGIKKESVLYPVWFLTWRKKNRVAYSAMNGQTGSLSVEVPVSLPKFFRSSILLSIVVFFILNFFSGFIIPMKIAGWASLFMLLTSSVLRKELFKIKLKENHVYDWGYKQKSFIQKIIPGTKSPSSWLGSAVSFFFYMYILVLVCDIFGIKTPKDVYEFFRGMVVMQGIITIRQFVETLKIQKKSALITAFITMAIQLVCFFISMQNFAHDYWYYGMSIALYIGMIINVITSAVYINYLITQPVPDFYSREGADNGK